MAADVSLVECEGGAHRCEFCEELEQVEEAVFYCVHCAALLCDACKVKHEEHSVFKSHLLRVFTPPSEETPRCTKHPQKSAACWCNQCKQLICSRCTMAYHEDHPTSTIRDYYDKIISPLNQIKLTVDLTQETHRKTRLKIADKIRLLEREIAKTKSNIEWHSRALIEDIQIREMEILSKLDKLHQKEVDILERCLDKEDNIIQTIEDWKGKLSYMLSLDMSMKTLVKVKNICLEGEQIASHGPIIPQEPKRYEFIKGPSINNLGHLTTVETSPTFIQENLDTEEETGINESAWNEHSSSLGLTFEHFQTVCSDVESTLSSNGKSTSCLDTIIPQNYMLNSPRSVNAINGDHVLNEQSSQDDPNESKIMQKEIAENKTNSGGSEVGITRKGLVVDFDSVNEDQSLAEEYAEENADDDTIPINIRHSDISESTAISGQSKTWIPEHLELGANNKNDQLVDSIVEGYETSEETISAQDVDDAYDAHNGVVEEKINSAQNEKFIQHAEIDVQLCSLIENNPLDEDILDEDSDDEQDVVYITRNEIAEHNADSGQKEKWIPRKKIVVNLGALYSYFQHRIVEGTDVNDKNSDIVCDTKENVLTGLGSRNRRCQTNSSMAKRILYGNVRRGISNFEVERVLKRFKVGAFSAQPHCEFIRDFKSELTRLKLSLKNDVDIDNSSGRDDQANAFYFDVIQPDLIRTTQRCLNNIRTEHERKVKRSQLDPNKLPFPLTGGGYAADPDEFRQWLFGWRSLNCNIPSGKTAWHQLSSSLHTPHQIVQFEDYVRPWIKDWIPFSTRLQGGESAWVTISPGILKNDRVTKAQLQTYKAREARRDFHDKNRMARRRKVLELYFMYKYHYNLEKMIPFRQWSERLENNMKQLEALCHLEDGTTSTTDKEYVTH